MRLPYGVQADESEAMQAIEFKDPTRTVTVDIKARQRMVAQYAVAGRLGALVVGTDQAAEAVMGLFTKYGDGAFDVGPLLGLTKDGCGRSARTSVPLSTSWRSCRPQTSRTFVPRCPTRTPMA